MKSFFGFSILVLLAVSCGSRKINTDDLPQDIALKPARQKLTDSSSVVKKEEYDPGNEKKMQDLREEIDKLIASEICSDPSEWRISPLGAKPCGGPAKYIAYPKSKESEILSKIQKYTELQTAYNKAKNLVSDCKIVPPPSGIECKNGYAVLIQSGPSGNPEAK